MTHVLDFPDEILCKIFEYLSPFDALHSFINLNHRFNRLLTPFKNQIDFTYLSYEQFLYYIDHLLPMLSKDEPLNAMKLGNTRTPGQIKVFNRLMTDEHYRQYFNRIAKLLLQSPCFGELIDFVQKFLISLPNLLTLSIKIDFIQDQDFQRLNQLIINSVLSIPTLTKLSIEISTGLVLSHLPDVATFPSLVYVNLNLSLITDLLILIPRIPNVETLSISISWWTSRDQTTLRLMDEMRANGNQRSFFNQLKKFRLSINSIMAFQYEQFEEILHRILHDQQTWSFTLILNNNLTIDDHSKKLIDGQSWERLLGYYPSLTRFDLVIPINKYGFNEEDIIKEDSFQSRYFRDRKWGFSYLKYSMKNGIILYSIPYRSKESFDVLINDDILSKKFPINYSTILSMDHKSNADHQRTLDFILKHFPSLQELSLNHINTVLPIVNSLDIPSLHTLRIEREHHINLPNLFRLFPLINTLFVSYYGINNQSSLSENVCQYNRIIQLSLIGISETNINQVSVFLNQFPKLRYLHIYIQNRRLTNEIVLSAINSIIPTCPFLISLKIYLDKDLEFLTDPNDSLNTRSKMYLTVTTFDGVLLHLWF